MPRKMNTADVATIGIDIGKDAFHLIDLGETGAIVLQTKVFRSQLMPAALSGCHGGVFRRPFYRYRVKGYS